MEGYIRVPFYSSSTNFLLLSNGSGKRAVLFCRISQSHGISYFP
ncbi:hypothetical protein CLOSTHATH_04663 [Hungatella hathewayi DSM 13479]|uniref:Uncharacterized protein n=1 Tax=Hungatella hathewayi DSM 13479 TaxID=566550 RepID=D3AM14_9FIRM|nr:hypothetical protein CLOSTHATH_04663 [Hungatella hathewayi DSM 13479]